MAYFGDLLHIGICALGLGNLRAGFARYSGVLVPSVPLWSCSLGVLLSAGWLICKLHGAAASFFSIIAGVQQLSKVCQAFLLQPRALVPNEGGFFPQGQVWALFLL